MSMSYKNGQYGPLAVVSAATIVGSPLAGYVSSSGVVVATDTILTALEKIDGNGKAEVVRAMGVESSISTALQGVLSGDSASAVAGNLAIEVADRQAADALLVPKATTVNGQPLSANVVITPATLGLGNVSNTSDANKSIGGNAATVTTNANLSGVVTSVGNVTSIGNAKITNAMLANADVANLSGTNTGDETAITLKTKLGFTALSGSNTGDETNTTILNKLGIISIAGVNTGDESTASLKTKLGITAISGTNTGDETTASIITKLGIATLSGSNTGDETAATIKTKLGISALSGSNTGDQLISITGDVTATGSVGILTATVNNAAVIGKVLTNYASAAGTVDATDTILSAIQKIDGNVKALSGISINTQTAAYTTVLADASYSNHPGKSVVMNNPADAVITIPANVDVAYPVGATIEVIQYNAGKVTFAPGVGVAIHSAGNYLSIGARYSAVSLLQVEINSWVLIGQLAV